MIAANEAVAAEEAAAAAVVIATRIELTHGHLVTSEGVMAIVGRTSEKMYPLIGRSHSPGANELNSKIFSLILS